METRNNEGAFGTTCAGFQKLSLREHIMKIFMMNAEGSDKDLATMILLVNDWNEAAVTEEARRCTEIARNGFICDLDDAESEVEVEYGEC